MGLIQNLFNRRASDRAAGSGYRFFFGQSASGQNVNERSAMQMTAVYACVRVLAESIASLPKKQEPEYCLAPVFCFTRTPNIRAKFFRTAVHTRLDPKGKR